MSTVKRITLSGGEAFLDFDYLTSIARVTHSCGLLFRVVTNGSFAVDRVTAERAIGSLASIGIEAISLSWDQYHSRFIDPARIRNAICACRKYGVSVRLTAVVSKVSSLSSALELLGDEAFELPITQVKCLPVGRAERKVKPGDLLPPAPTDLKRACRADFDTMSLTPNGDVFPCCAVGGFTDGIRLGRYPDESIKSLLTRRDRDLFWIVLASQGPQFFVERMTEAEKVKLGLVPGALHDCVVCHRLFRDPAGAQVAVRVTARLREQASLIWTELVSTDAP
ncbi:hypothetical protein J2Z31_002820 [Sinorhizobium kostiense]|uniref:4Fe4S-binding SPASM domain-containing protein n=1 Tax=Sinorhizobium kostiense TaxID=76747 RepID=A0ABS4R1P6_9HYPH|nr:hypothetical protein [Sinorhizobium kostiense]